MTALDELRETLTNERIDSTLFGRCERTDAALARVEAELAALRETNQKLNRRCQSAEAGLAAKLTSGPSFGRALANAAATIYHEQLAESLSELAELRKRPTLEQALEAITRVRAGTPWHRHCAWRQSMNAIRALYGEAET